MVGIIDDISQVTTTWFKSDGHDIYLIGESKDEIGGTEYLRTIRNLVTGKIPHIDLELHKKTINFVLAAIKEGLVQSAQDLSDGGLAVALAECCFKNNVGATVTLEPNIRIDSLLFGETQSRAIVSALPEHQDRISKLAAIYRVPLARIGITGGRELKINDWIDLPVEKLNMIYEEAIPKLMEQITAADTVKA
jgi:phosphoribosylformylglycinamidine synthase